MSNIGKYKIIQIIGKGTMGTTYKVQDPLGALYVLKIILLSQAQEEEINKIRQEIQLLLSLQHPNIASIRDFGVYQKKYYFVMDFVEGVCLSNISKPINLQNSLSLIVKIAEIIHYAHQKNIIYRDLKPSNVIINNRSEPVLLDFGIAKTVDRDLLFTQSGKISRTWEYVAPEQMRGVQFVDQRCDVYSLGAILYELLTGKLPKGYATDETLALPSSLSSQLPATVDQMVMKAFAKNPPQRYQTMQEFATALTNFFNQQTQSKSSGKAQLPKISQHYRVIELIGKGGMGKVYKVHNIKLNKMMALKIPNANAMEDKDQVKRFLREAKISSKLDHPGIIKVYDVEQSEEGIPFFTMEFIVGNTLHSLLKEKQVPIRKAVNIMSKILEAVDYAHEQGIVHRDLKPANIIISENNELKVMDFGLAKAITNVSEKLSQTGMILGTMQYMSPEQVEGKLDQIDQRSDLYSLGIIFYELLTGTLPFTGNTIPSIAVQIIEKQATPPSKLNDKIPQYIEDICLKALEKEKAKRYEDAKQFLQAFSQKNKAPKTKSNLTLLKWSLPAILGVIIFLVFLLPGKQNKKISKAQKANKSASKNVSKKVGRKIKIQQKFAVAVDKNKLAKMQQEFIKLPRNMPENEQALSFVEKKWNNFLDVYKGLVGAEETLNKAKEKIKALDAKLLQVRKRVYARQPLYPRAILIKDMTPVPRATMERTLKQMTSSYGTAELANMFSRKFKDKDLLLKNLSKLPKDLRLLLISVGRIQTIAQYEIAESARSKSIINTVAAIATTRMEFNHEKKGLQGRDGTNEYILNITERETYDTPFKKVSPKPQNWNKALWSVIWNGQWANFSLPIWKKLEHNQKIAYAKEYQKWYAQRLGWPAEKIFTHKTTRFSMIFIPPGKFLMGSPVNEHKRNRDEIQRIILITYPFWIGKYEITQQQWQNVIGNNPSWFKNLGDMAPVEKVSWYRVQEFCKKIGARLPTEAEWEHAARAGTTTAFHFGKNVTRQQVNYDSRNPYFGKPQKSTKSTIAVNNASGENSWGGVHFHGNVYEWCHDWYALYSNTATNPEGPDSGKVKVIRGGGYYYGARYSRSAARSHNSPQLSHDSLGFRIVMPVYIAK